MMEFYNLRSASVLSSSEAVYGRPGWETQFGRAEWTHIVDMEQVICPVRPGHRRPGKRVGELVIVLPSPKTGDFAWTWYSDCLITDRVLNLFRQAGLTGFQDLPVKVEKVKKQRGSDGVLAPVLWELSVTGKGGDACPESGIRVIETCEACNLIRYSSYRNGIIVDKEQWDGSDFFTVNGYPRFILVTERVRDLVTRNGLTNCMLIPSRKLRWQSLTRPEDSHRPWP